MRVSRYPLFTSKETPADAEIISHQLMLRAGMIQKVAAGLYTWLPIGLRVLRKVEQIVREEMNGIDAMEVLMPAVQPAELWQESGRWDQFGALMLRIRDRHERDFCFGPTHEEVVTDLVRREIKSYRQLPVSYYQIQTKFRDETRPRFGVMRAREFLMKDAYSFHLNHDSLVHTYEAMRGAYERIFSRAGLNFRAVQADPGAIGGSGSEEFHVLADSGEDAIASCTQCGYAANTELATSKAPPVREEPPAAAEEKATPDIETVAEQAEMLGIDTTQVVKSLVVVADDQPVVLFAVGDDEINLTKVARALGASDVRLATAAEASEATGVPKGFIGPKGLPEGLRLVVDERASRATNFSSGSNRADYHWVNLNWGRDVALPEVADIRTVNEGEGCPDCEGTLEIRRGIEVGHIFQLGTKYSESMDALVLDESGRNVPMEMGCYGIGVSRVVAAAIEQNHDDAGIIWPTPLAPFKIAIVSINMHRSEAVAKASQQLYERLAGAGWDPLWDDREARPGVKFADMELIGIPHRVVVSDRGLEAGTVEYRGRRDSESQNIPVDELLGLLERQEA